MTTTTCDRATAAQGRGRIMGSRNEFWRPEDLATSGSTTLHLLADFVEAGELIRSGQLRAAHLARGSQTEPGKVRARLRALLVSLGEHALVEQIPMPDRRTTESALAILRDAGPTAPLNAP